MTNSIEVPGFAEAYQTFRQNQTGPIYSIPRHEAVLALYRAEARQELDTRFEGKMWLGPDIAVNKDVVIPPNGMAIAEIDIDPILLQPFFELSNYAIACARLTTRSRFAQLGIHVPSDASGDIAKNFHQVEKPDGSKAYASWLPVINYARRPILLPEGTTFFYPYFWNSKFMKGKEIKDALNNNLFIKGEQGRDWNFWYGIAPEGNDGEIQGIELNIDETSHAYIPQNDETMSINHSPAENHNRSSVDQYLVKPVPQSTDRILWIGETKAEIELAKGVNGMFNWVVPRPTYDPRFDYEFQTNSVIAIGGNARGKMRTEIYSATTPELMPKSTVMRFVKG
ncbi:MAG TPA: hypothetical protein VG917_01760 [Patescibacteria group bacterium]|nr:hypothetical protein [Patescibacteria group bacterium]